MADGGQDIDVVIVGRNCDKTLRACVESVRSAFYTRGRIHIFYIDRNSSDNSLDVARTISDMAILEFTTHIPHLGEAMNAGWEKGHGTLVQFLDADVIMSPQWFQEATKGMTSEISAMSGRLEEVDPREGPLHLVSHIEGTPRTGDVETCLRNALIRRDDLEEVGGFVAGLDEGLEYDLCVRIKLLGKRVVQINALMGRHHLTDVHFEALWTRLYHEGSAIAVAALREPQSPYWQARYREIQLRGGTCLLLFILGVGLSWFSAWWLLLLFPATILLLQPRIFTVERLTRDYGLDPYDASTLSWYRSLSVIPRCLGAFFKGRAKASG